MNKRKTFRTGLLLALLAAATASSRADSGVPDRSNAFGYEFTQAELDSFPQKTNLPTVYLQIYSTNYDAETDKTSLNLTGDGKPQFANIWDVFGNKHEWYYISKIVIRDDYGTIKERNEWLGVRGRGNSTWFNEGSNNKPLRLKFNKKADLLTRMENGVEVNDYATDKNWTLLANHYDATRIRNALAIELEKRMGMAFVPACKFVDLVVMVRGNDQNHVYHYMGTYQISDHVNVADRRVPIDKKTGYFLEGNIDDTWGRFQEDPYIEVPFGEGNDTYKLLVNVKSPDPDVATPTGPSTDPKYDALKERLAMVAQMLYSGDASWRKYVDLKSAADVFVLTEITANYDGAYANNYCYMNNIDGKIVFGPVWDLDLTFNYNLEKDITGKHFWQFKDSPFAKLCEKAWADPFFMKAVYERFQELQNGHLQDFLETKAAELKESISQSLAYNFAAENWQGDRNIGGAGNRLNPSDWADKNSYTTVEDAYTVMNDFIPNRTSFVATTFQQQYKDLKCENAVCTDHDYANCTFAMQNDGTYRRVCNICSEAETEGDAYYYFTVYPESSAAQSFYATDWQPSEEYPNAIATVDVDASVMPTGCNIVNTRKDAAGNKTCADFRLVDGHPFYSDDKFVATTATYKRSVTNNWGTMILPFDLQQAETATARFFHLGEVTNDAENNPILVMTAIDPSEADNAVGYTPVFFMRKGSAETVEVTAQKVTVKKVGKNVRWENSTVEGWTLTGVMQKTQFYVADEAYAASDIYYIKNNEFLHATGNLSTNPFRAYLSTAKAQTDASRSLHIALADDPSLVKELALDNCLAIFGGYGEVTVVAPRTTIVSISTLGGALVRKQVLQAGEQISVQMPKGVCLVNGVKIVVK